MINSVSGVNNNVSFGRKSANSDDNKPSVAKKAVKTALVVGGVAAAAVATVAAVKTGKGLKGAESVKVMDTLKAFGENAKFWKWDWAGAVNTVKKAGSDVIEKVKPEKAIDDIV